jgi:hypothetical protein
VNAPELFISEKRCDYGTNTSEKALGEWRIGEASRVQKEIKLSLFKRESKRSP